MDSSIIAAVSALLGSAVGGLTTFATTFFNRRYVARREMLVKDVANREQLYAEFLKEVGWGDVADRGVKPHGVVVIDETGDQATGVLEVQGDARADALGSASARSLLCG